MHNISTVVDLRQSTLKIHKLKDKKGNNTDCIWLDVWIGCVILYVILAFYGMVQGNPGIIGKPMDPDHNACGVDPLVINYPFIYFVSPQDGYLFRTVCLSTCPNSTESTLDCKTNSLIDSCEKELSPNDPSKQTLVYATLPLLNSVCVPTNLALLRKITPALSLPLTQLSAHNVYNCKSLIIFAFFFSILLSCLIFRMVDRYSCLIIWSFAIVVVVTIFVMALNFYIEDYSYQQLKLESVKIKDIPFTNTQVAAYVHMKNNNNTELFTFFSLFFMLGIYMLFHVQNQTQKMQKLDWGLHVAGEFLSWNQDLIKVPVIMSLILGGNFFLYLFGVMHLLSAGVYSTDPNQLPFNQFSFGAVKVSIALLMTFIWLWMSVTLCTTVDFITNCLVAHWYDQQSLSEEERNVPYFNNVTINILRLHLGSIAKCSFLIIVLSPVRLVLSPLKLFQTQLEKFLKCQCTTIFSKSFAATIKFYDNQVIRADTDAYYIVYLSSQDFSESSTELLAITKEHQELYESIKKIGDLFTFRGALFLSLISALFSYVLFRQSAKLSAEVLTPVWPAFFIGIMAYQVGYVFMGIFGEIIQGLTCMYINDRELVNNNFCYGFKAPLIVHNFFFLLKKLIPKKDRHNDYQ